MAKQSIYALYRGDEFIDLGTLEELEERLIYSTPAYKKRIRNPDITINHIIHSFDNIANEFAKTEYQNMTCEQQLAKLETLMRKLRKY